MMMIVVVVVMMYKLYKRTKSASQLPCVLVFSIGSGEDVVLVFKCA